MVGWQLLVIFVWRYLFIFGTGGGRDLYSRRNWTVCWWFNRQNLFMKFLRKIIPSKIRASWWWTMTAPTPTQRCLPDRRESRRRIIGRLFSSSVIIIVIYLSPLSRIELNVQEKEIWKRREAKESSYSLHLWATGNDCGCNGANWRKLWCYWLYESFITKDWYT